MAFPLVINTVLLFDNVFESPHGHCRRRGWDCGGPGSEQILRTLVFRIVVNTTPIPAAPS